VSSDALLRKPITGLAGCCAPAAPGCRAAEKRDDLTPFHHSITSSARSRIAAEQRDEVAPFQLIPVHSIPVSQGRIAGYRIGENQSGGNGTILQLASH
jgi:hypothetical protein